MTLSIRPHHAMCIILFSEIGHSAPYISIMREHIATLSSNPQTIVTLCSELDTICRFCPHNNNHICGKSDEVDISDRKILSYCGLEFGHQSTWENLQQNFVENILNMGLLCDACKGCMYLPRCKDHSLYES